METKTLEQKVAEEFSKHRYSPYALDQLLPMAKNSPVLQQLFKEFAGNKSLLRLLSMHRLDLFGFENDIKSSVLLYCNLPKYLNGNGKNQVPSALKFIIQDKIEQTEENGLAFFRNTVGDVDAVSEDFKDIIAYFLIDFLRNNPALLELANGDNFSYEGMKEKLKDYVETINISPFFEDRINNFTKTVDPVIRKKVEKIVLQVVTNLCSKMEQVFEGFSKLTPDLTMVFHQQAILWLSMVLEKTEDDFENYTENMDVLFRIKAIESKHVVTWCESCNKHEPNFQMHIGKIVPSNVRKKRECIQCQNKSHYSFSAVYGLDSVLKDVLNSKDGLLATYLAWLADKRGMSVECSKFAGKFETDILLNGKYLVECKNFRAEKDENAMKVNIGKAFTQLENQILKFAEAGIQIKEAFLLWNLETTDADLQGMLDLSFKNFREKYGCKIVAYHEIEAFVNSLK